MSKPSLWTTSNLLWLTAFSGLVVASVTLRADRGGVIGLTCCCVLLSLVAMVTEHREASRPIGQSWPVYAVLGIAGGVELITLIVLGGDWDLIGLWYCAGLAQAILGGMLAYRREPRDAVLLCVLSFHMIVNFPSVFLLVLRLLRWKTLTIPALSPWAAHPELFMVATVIILVPLFVCLAFSMLLLEAHQPAQERHRGWSVHLVGLMATAIMLARWSVRGL